MSAKTILEKLDEGRQYRDIDMSRIERRAEDNGDMIVEGYATVFEQPYLLWKWSDYEVWEVVDKEAFDETDMSDVIMQYNHEGRVFARGANGTLAVGPDDVGLHTRARLSGTTLGREIYEEIDGGYSTKMSFGFTIGKEDRHEEEDHDTGLIKVTRRILSVSKLYDVSVVSLPANDATSISARSFAEGVIREILEERQEALKRARQKQKIRILAGGIK